MANPLFRAGLEIQHFIEERQWRFCFIGGLALLRWGQIRMTQDVDLSLFAPYGQEVSYIDALLENFDSRIPDAGNFARDNRVLLLRASCKVPMDVCLASLPFEEEMMNRASSFDYAEGYALRTCSAEDLVILKAFANRTQDWADVESILLRQQCQLEIDYIIECLEPLCQAKSAPEIMNRIRKMIVR